MVVYILSDHLYIFIVSRFVARCFGKLSRYPMIVLGCCGWVSGLRPDVPLSWRGHHGDIPPPESRPDDAEQLQLLAPAGSELARKLDRWPDGIPTEAVRALRSDYADHLHLLDTQLGILLQRLDMRSDQPTTAVTVCSDHGELLEIGAYY